MEKLKSVTITNDENVLSELHDIIKILSQRNLLRLLAFARGLSKNGS